MMCTTHEVRDNLWNSAWDLVDSKVKIELTITISDEGYRTITFIMHRVKTPIIRELKDAVA